MFGFRERLHAYPFEAEKEAATLPPWQPVLGGPSDDFGGGGPGRRQCGPPVGRGG